MEIGKGEALMPTLEDDGLVFRFPDVEGKATFRIDFQRTLRIPDSSTTYGLPPGFDTFPLRHVEDYPETISNITISRGGVMLPIWQAEALWLNFTNRGPSFDVGFPVAIKVAAGKINAVTGEDWRSGLNSVPQDYMVSPAQPWLDGFMVEKGVVRQFVAMPLGEGYSVEEQLTGRSEWGGLQIAVTPLKVDAWRDYRRRMESSASHALSMNCPTSSSLMGLGAGGRMRQVIYPDPFDVGDWDTSATERVFVSLVPAADWCAVTGESTPNRPLSAQDYARAKLPWFEYYGNDQSALPSREPLQRVKSVAMLYKQTTSTTLPNSEDVVQGPIRKLGPSVNRSRPVRSSGVWE
jgi:hypothetical protein